MKKLIALLLALVMVLGLVACGTKEAPKTEEKKEETSAPAQTEEKKEETKTEEKKEETSAPATEEKKVPTIAFVPKVIGQAWWDYVKAGVEAWSKDNGIDVIYALLTFYLDQNGDVLVRLSEIIRHGAKHIGAVRNGDAANAFRWVTG